MSARRLLAPLAVAGVLGVAAAALAADPSPPAGPVPIPYPNAAKSDATPARPADVILQDGARAIIDDNKLFMVDKNGRRTPATDGTYKTRDGGVLVSRRGVIVQGPGKK